MLFAFDAAAVDETLAYLVSLWLPVLGSFGLVELLSSRTRPSRERKRTHEAPVDARLAPVHAGRARRVAGA
jgi:hypothetical protein